MSWRDKVLMKMSEMFLVIDDFGEPGVHEKIMVVREI
jgi:hypothetical protein